MLSYIKDLSERCESRAKLHTKFTSYKSDAFAEETPYHLHIGS